MKLLSIMIFAFLLFIKVQRSSSTPLTKIEIVTPYKYVKCFNYKFENAKSSCFGYKKNVEDASIGVTNLYIDGPCLYVVDSYHNCVKIIDIYTGGIKNNIEIANANRWYLGLQDIRIRKNCLIITSGTDSVYTVDLRSQKVNSIYAVSSLTKYIFAENDTSVFIMLNEKQETDFSISLKLLQVNSCADYKVIYKNEPFSDYQKYVRSSRIREDSFAIKKNGSQYILAKSNKLFQLPNAINKITDYNAVNIDFKDSVFAYFYTKQDTLKIQVVGY